MDVRLPDGTIIRGVPDGMSKADLTAKLARNGYDISKLEGSAPDAIPQNAEVQGDPGPDGRYPSGVTRRTTQADIDNAARLRNQGNLTNNDGVMGRILGPLEAIPTMASGMVNTIVGNLAGVGKTVLDGKLGTQEGVRDAKKIADAYVAENTYQPRTDTGKNAVAQIGTAMAPLEGLQGVPAVDGMRMVQQATQSARTLRGMAQASAAVQGAQDAAMVAGAPKLSLRDLVGAQKPPMPGVGAATTAEAVQRAQRFANMRSNMKPTQGILTRSIDDVQFEREAAKRPEGRALDARFAELNQGMEQHMNSLIETTGAKSSSSRITGKTIRDAIEAKKKVKKAEIKQAYAEAREAGDMAELIDTQKVAEFLEKNRSAMRNAPILATAEDELARLSKNGKISINDMEELRKMVGKAGKPNASNANSGYTPDIIRLIDESTTGKGGVKYQQARRVYENYANEFKNRDVIDKLLRYKPGTKDRAVARADVADHIIDSSYEDMRHAFRVLEAHPAGTAPEIIAAGKQAANEIRGAAAARLKERMFSNGGADSQGRVVGSEIQMRRVVEELDSDGRLEALFGKKGAAEIRDTAQVATDMYSTPKGTINTSNTASAMEKVLNRMAGTFGGIPVAGHAIKYATKRIESRNYQKKVDKALNPPQTLRDMTRGTE